MKFYYFKYHEKKLTTQIPFVSKTKFFIFSIIKSVRDFLLLSSIHTRIFCMT